jgi:hypothetical protein
MNWKITEDTIRNLCRDGEGGVRSDPAALSIAVDGLLHALSEVQRKMGDLDYTTERLAKQIEREVRRRRMAWAKRLRAIGGIMLMAGIIAAIVGIPWPGVARWPLLVALSLGPAMSIAGDILSGDILGGKL